MNILYFVVGNSPIVHLQVMFSLRTFAAQLSKEDRIIVMTETPMLYSCDECHCKVEIIPLSEQQIKEWRTIDYNGKNGDFFWRIKIKAIEAVGKLYPDEPIMYLDGDTCLAGNLSEIKALLNNGTPLMHKDEGSLHKMKHHSLRMWNQTKGREYGGVTIDEHFHEWNAGVVAIPAYKIDEVSQKALEICDKMIVEGVEPLFVEQYSLAVALFSKYPQMQAAEKWIIHYWHNKHYWSTYICKFFTCSYMTMRSFADELDVIRHINMRTVNWFLKVKRIIRKHIFGKKS